MKGAALYAEVPYSKFPYVQTHPDRLATLAVLHGLAPRPAAGRARARAGLRRGRQHGADGVRGAGPERRRRRLRRRRGRRGPRDRRALGLRNVELHEGDVRELAGGGLGTFDYVIAHGVYGWVAPAVRDALLAAIAAHLARRRRRVRLLRRVPGRLLPADAARDGPVPRARRAAPGVARAEAARELFGVLAELRADRADAYGAVLARELPRLLYRPAGSLVHDDLADDLDAGLVRRLRRPCGGARARVRLRGGGRRAAARAAAGGRRAAPARARRRRPAGARAVRRLPARAASSARACSAAPAPGGRSTPRTCTGSAPRPPSRRSSTPTRWSRRSCACSARHFPEALPVRDLRRTLGAGAADAERAVWAAVDADLVALHVRAPAYAASAGERPRASALARLQAEQAIDVTSLRHENVRMEEPAARLLLALLDGTRDRAALRADLAAAGGPELPARGARREPRRSRGAGAAARVACAADVAPAPDPAAPAAARLPPDHARGRGGPAGAGRACASGSRTCTCCTRPRR